MNDPMVSDELLTPLNVLNAVDSPSKNAVMLQLDACNPMQIVNSITTVTSNCNDSSNTHQCVLCSESFTKRAQLAEHIKTKHSICVQTVVPSRNDSDADPNHESSNSSSKKEVVDQRYACPECGRSYARLFLLTMHIKSAHERIRDFICAHCLKGFSKRSVLVRHIKCIHSDTKNFLCDICGKQFVEKGNLDLHISSCHKNHKPFQCSSCEKRFARRCDLNRHMQCLHTVFKRFTCFICCKGFPQKWHLDRHVHLVHFKSETRENAIRIHDSLVTTTAKSAHGETVALPGISKEGQISDTHQLLQAYGLPKHASGTDQDPSGLSTVQVETEPKMVTVATPNEPVFTIPASNVELVPVMDVNGNLFLTQSVNLIKCMPQPVISDLVEVPGAFPEVVFSSSGDNFSTSSLFRP